MIGEKHELKVEGITAKDLDMAMVVLVRETQSNGRQCVRQCGNVKQCNHCYAMLSNLNIARHCEQC